MSKTLFIIVNVLLIGMLFALLPLKAIADDNETLRDFLCRPVDLLLYSRLLAQFNENHITRSEPETKTISLPAFICYLELQEKSPPSSQ